ncbi:MULTISPECIES: hypothetical protein [unclassified Actinomadura]|uniref:hypothetical protein n=1 Tax=unclassified Actinomadura TaxID=2626254 RepID=UPI0011EEF6D8|nr:hypothetical protein [Actinomadura sp. K4S16]
MNAEPSPQVLILAMDPRGHKRGHARVASLVASFLDEEGARVDVVTAEPRGWEKLDERVRLHRLDGTEARHPLLWLEQAVVSRAPRRIVRPLNRLGRPGAVLGRAQSRVSDAVHRRLFLPFYGQVRPLLLARIARRRVLSGIDMAKVSRVVVMDDASVPCAWRLARRHPDVTVTTRQVRTLDPAR